MKGVTPPPPTTPTLHSMKKELIWRKHISGWQRIQEQPLALDRRFQDQTVRQRLSRMDNEGAEARRDLPRDIGGEKKQKKNSQNKSVETWEARWEQLV